MSRVLTLEQMQEMLSERQQQPSEATRAESRGTTRVDGICLSGRPQMPLGWLNSVEGYAWMQQRAGAFSRMDTGGRMNFGFLTKNKDK